MEMEDKSMKFTKLTILAGSFLLLFSLSSAGENAVKKECERACHFAQKVNERKKVIQSKLRKFKDNM